MNTTTKENLSISPITGKKYQLPTNTDDKADIDQFLAKNLGKKVVVVQGLGFVGAVMSLVVANALTEEYAVIGIDLAREYTYWKIRSINEGLFPVIADDPKIGQFYQKTREKGNLYATFDPYAYSKADFIVVDINLDVQKTSNETKDLETYGVDMNPFRKAMYAIGENCKPNVHILVETTVPPGTCQKIVKPILTECMEHRELPLDQFTLGHSYERVMPGPQYINSIQNFYRVFSGIDEKSAIKTEQFLRTIITTEEYPLTRLGNTNATEMAKVLENSYRAMNIAFMVEWSRFAEEAGVNIYEVVNAIRMRPTHKNMMLPGLGVGGYCLTKDPLLASWSRQTLFGSADRLGQSERGVMINDKMPLYAFQFLEKSYGKSLAGQKVLLLGVSYLNDVGDTRYTPVEPLFDYLKTSGADITLHDPHVPFWEEKNISVSADLEKCMEHSYDIIIISTGHKNYRNNPWLIDKILNQASIFVLDTIGVLNEQELTQISTKHTVKVVGRGDL
jgi:UDP-N-acetyl-D-glucosamine dehydrogenase